MSMGNGEPQLAPGAYSNPFLPSVFGLGMAKSDDGEVVVVLRIEHAAGTTVCGLEQEAAEKLGEQLIAASKIESSKLTLPSDGDVKRFGSS